MANIKRFFECLLPVTVCNLECPYCYVIQENRRTMQQAKLKYTPEHIANALRPERVGGTCYISICGAGETLAQAECVDIVHNLLVKGHYVNITTNGTLSHRFDQLIAVCTDNIRHLHISFSLHYTELLRKGWLELFFQNVQKMKNAGASILVQINLCDEYIPYIDEINNICAEKVGAYPQVALTRDESTIPFTIFTKHSNEEYYTNGKEFGSPLFDFTTHNFMVKRKEFCFAGDWSGTLNLQTGVFRKCYADPDGVNIFEDLDESIPFAPVGKACRSDYCVNSSHFLSLGVIPELKTPSYAQLRNREVANWYTDEMSQFLNSKLYDSNSQFLSKTKYIRNRFQRFFRLTLRERLSQFRFYQHLHEIKVRVKNGK